MKNRKTILSKAILWDTRSYIHKLKAAIVTCTRPIQDQDSHQGEDHEHPYPADQSITVGGEGSAFFKGWFLVSSKCQWMAPHPRVCGQCKLTSEREVGRGIKLGVSEIWDTSGRS